jgi:hypothetical protein
VGSVLVVVGPSLLDPVPGIGHGQEPRNVRHFARGRLLNASMAALSVGLPGREKSISPSSRPTGQHAPGKLRAVVGPKAVGTTALLRELVQTLDPLIGPEAHSRGNRERLSRVAVHHRQDPERRPSKSWSAMSRRRARSDQVHGPDLRWFRRPPADSDDRTRPACDEAPWGGSRALRLWRAGPCACGSPSNPPVAKGCAASRAVPNPGCRELFVAHAQLGLWSRPPAITRGRSVKACRSAGPPLAPAVGGPKGACDLAPSRGPHPFRRSTSWSMVLSRCRVALRRTKRLTWGPLWGRATDAREI